jgi:hypothetical protein
LVPVWYENTGGCRRFRAAFSQVLVKEGQHHLAPEFGGGVAAEVQRAQAGAVVIDAAVAPRSHHQVVHIVVLVELFGGGVGA